MPISSEEISALVESSTLEEIAATADAWQEAGEDTAALQLLEAAVLKWPKHGGLLHNLGMAREELEDHQGAIGAYTEAIARGYESQVNRGFSFEQIQDWDRARADYQRALTMDPKNVEALVNLGTMDLSLGLVASGTLRLKAAAALDARANWQLADGYLARNQREDAKRALLLAVDEGEQRALLDLARMEIGYAPRSTVESYFAAAIAAGVPLARRELAVFLDDEGETRSALDVALTGIALGDADCYAPAAVICEELGERDRAIEFYTLAIANGEEDYEEDLAELQSGNDLK